MTLGKINFKKVAYAGMAVELKQAPQEGRPEIVLAGRSNVGKSSLVNGLCNRKAIARVSSTPGKTQAVQYFLVDDQFYLTDLPGYGYAKVAQSKQQKFAQLVDHYLQADRPICGVLHLIDIRHKPSLQDRQMQAWLEAANIPYAVILTKADKISGAALGRQRSLVAKTLGLSAGLKLPAVSNSKRTGYEEVEQQIEVMLSLFDHP